MTCQVEGCDRTAHHWVTNNGRTLNVCVKCRDEMTALHGWTIRTRRTIFEQATRFNPYLPVNSK